MKRLSIVFAFFVALFISSNADGERIEYPWRFNPVDSYVADVERGFREEICMNGKWQFMPVYSNNKEDFIKPEKFQWEEVPLKIPSPWNVNTFTDGMGGDFVAYPSYPKEWENARIGWMRKTVDVPSTWDGRHLVLHFEGIMGKAEIYVNGEKAGENFELFLPCEFDVTDLIRPGQSNEIIVGVAKGDLFDIPGKCGRRTYVGGSMWGTEMAGIWQDVYLLSYSPVFVSDVFVQADTDSGMLKAEVEITNTTGEDCQVTVGGDVYKWYSTAGKTIQDIPSESWRLADKSSLSLETVKNVRIPAGKSVKVTVCRENVTGLEYWTPDTPNLYGLVLSLQNRRNVVDVKYERFGWRSFKVEGEKLLLNGEQIQLHGDSWHFTGVPQMTRRYAWSWFNMLKNNNANAVRFHAQPYPSFYLDMADEMGICVLDETGIWSSDGGPKIDSEDYWKSCVEHIRRFFKRDKNHPSVFGWSVCNETLPVAMHVFRAPDSLVQRQIKEINRWVSLFQELDPTRQWISGDGETGPATHLPTLIGHYGGYNDMKHWASQGKPWGIGEQGMAYFGTPKQTAEFNGDRSYESMEGRMEAIAKEGYELIRTQRELNASYCSIFNLAWYGLKPLNLGLPDKSLKPAPEDGIFFTRYVEGESGMQPERLGPYTTNFNPGYDPSLPLYEEWPMMEAVRCAFATPIKPCPEWPQGRASKSDAIAEAVSNAAVLSTDKSLEDILHGYGVQVVPFDIRNTSFLFIDAARYPSAMAGEIKSYIESGKPVMIVNMNKESLSMVNEILPYKVALEDRTATSFLVTKDISETDGMTHADFYFTEILPGGKYAMSCGMTGDFINHSYPIIEACNTEWRTWNYHAETSKTGYVYRSENEAKGSGKVLSRVKDGKYDIILSTLDISEIRPMIRNTMVSLLNNIGIMTSENVLSDVYALDSNLSLSGALVCGPFGEDDGMNIDNLGNPSEGAEAGGSEWKLVKSSRTGLLTLPESEKSSGTYYLSFHVFSPRSLSNLLLEPDMPSLDMFYGGQENVTFWLNGKKMDSNATAAGNEMKIANILLDKGWNHIIVEIKTGNDRNFRMRFSTDDAGLKKEISSSI